MGLQALRNLQNASSSCPSLYNMAYMYGNNGSDHYEPVEVTPKSPAYIFGERVGRPIINYSYHLFNGVKSSLNSLDAWVKRTFEIFPVASAKTISLAEKSIAFTEKDDCASQTSIHALKIIHREDLLPIHDVSIDGVTHFLGELRDFRNDDYLSHFIPENSKLAMAWVKLKSGEILNPHVHPIASMITICEGEGEFIGDFKHPLKAGDIIAVPPGIKHGFIGHGVFGFTALSIQFEQRGLYENPQEPLVQLSNTAPSNDINEITFDELKVKINSVVKRTQAVSHYAKDNLLSLAASIQPNFLVWCAALAIHEDLGVVAKELALNNAREEAFGLQDEGSHVILAHSFFNQLGSFEVKHYDKAKTEIHEIYKHIRNKNVLLTVLSCLEIASAPLMEKIPVLMRNFGATDFKYIDVHKSADNSDDGHGIKFLLALHSEKPTLADIELGMRLFENFFKKVFE